jgi:hypothetical protein
MSQHPFVDEFLRWRLGDPVRRDVQIRWQQMVRDQVMPVLDRAMILDAENATLRAENESLLQQLTAPKPAKGKIA